MFDCFLEVFALLLIGIVVYRVLDRLVRYPAYTFSGTEHSKYILVTGCGRGFGERLVKRLDSRGFSVFAACQAQEAVDRLNNHPSRLRLKAFVMNVKIPESVQTGLKFVEDNIPGGEGLWALVNNAGITGSKYCPADCMDVDDFRWVCEVNLFGLINTTMAFLPLVKKAKGRIVNMTSAAGRISSPCMGPYNVSKYGAEAYSDTLRREIKAFGVSVHIMQPGFFATSIVDPQTTGNMVTKAWSEMTEEKRQEYGEDYRARLQNLAAEVIPKLASNNIDSVIEAYEHAIFAWYPRARYLLGWDARLLFYPLSIIPEWLSDFLFGLGLRKPAATLAPNSSKRPKVE